MQLICGNDPLAPGSGYAVPVPEAHGTAKVTPALGLCWNALGRNLVV